MIDPKPLPAPQLEGLSLAEKRMLLAELLQEKARREQQQASCYPLTHGQRGLWFLHRMNPSDPAYNIYFPFRIRSRLDRPAYRRALQALVDRHPALRTTFEERDGELVQQVHDQAKVWLQEIDASSWSEEALRRRIEEVAHEPFDLQQGPLVRMYLFTRTEEDHVFLLSAHHIIGDFWSLVVILEEMQTIYPSLCQGATPALPPPASHYRDFVRWQEEMLAGPEGERLWSWWQRQLTPLPAILDLPTDHPRPARFSHRGSHVICRLGPNLTHQLRALAAAEQVTLYTVLLAGFQALLGRYSGQEDFAIGSPFAGRSRPAFKRIVGYFINMVPLRANLTGNPTFRSLLRQVGATVLEGLEHQDYPFQLLVERLKVPRDSSRSPLFQTTFALEKARLSAKAEAWRFAGPQKGNRSRVGGLQVESYAMKHRTCHTDIDLVLEEGDETVEGMLQYNTDLFDEATMTRMVGHFQTLLEGAAADPGRRLSELPLLTVQEQRQLRQWNETQANYPQGVCLHQLFEQQAARNPGAVAVRCGDRTVSYGELDAAANRVAARLQELGAGPGTFVALGLGRSPELIAAILGTLKAGAAYVPLDPDSPAERLGAILADVQPRILVTEPALQQRFLRVASGEWRELNHRDTETQREELFCSSLCLCVSVVQFPPTETRAVTPEDLAYVIFTSGSTGRPKGVMVEHRSVCNTVFWHCHILGLGPGDRSLLFLPIFFDASICVIFPALAAGAEVVLAQAGAERDPSLLLECLVRDKVTIWTSGPSMLRVLLDQLFRGMRDEGRGMKEDTRPSSLIPHPSSLIPSRLRWVCCGGEPMPAALPAQVLELLDVGLLNLYGPTEVAVDATSWQVRRTLQQGEPLPSLPPIGRPIHNVQVHVLDAHRQPVPIGVPGELYVGGAGVARGYLNDPQLTAERFLPDPARGPGARLYRTGDRCRWLPSGYLEFLGRLDQQVKIRGYRIEVGEIETALELAPGVKQAVVTALPDAAGNSRLVAYVVPAPGPAGLPAAPKQLNLHEATPLLRRHLKDRLPDYMVPASFVVLSELPCTPSGKVDRKKLPAPRSDGQRGAAHWRPPETPLEEHLAGLWRELLQLDQVNTLDNFFELGGNSIDAALLINRLQEKLGQHISTVAIFDAPTIAGLARHLGELYPETISRLFGLSSASRERQRPEVVPPVADAPGSPKSLLVPLQPEGSLPAFFMVHPPGGIVVCYQPLARHLGTDRPIFGIRARGLHGEQEIPTRLEEMAAEYVAAIRAVQPEGPYHLGGWSMGGIVAFEMAQQLLAQGQQVGLLALLDTTIPTNPGNQHYAQEELDPGREYGLEISLEELDRLGPEEQLPYLWQHVQRLGLLEVDTPLPVVQQILDDLKRLFHAHITMANEYLVRPYPGHITLFRPSEVPVVVETAEDRGWGKVARSVEVHFVPGHHHTMVKEPHVQVLARQLTSCLVFGV